MMPSIRSAGALVLVNKPFSRLTLLGGRVRRLLPPGPPFLAGRSFSLSSRGSSPGASQSGRGPLVGSGLPAAAPSAFFLAGSAAGPPPVLPAAAARSLSSGKRRGGGGGPRDDDRDGIVPEGAAAAPAEEADVLGGSRELFGWDPTLDDGGLGLEGLGGGDGSDDPGAPGGLGPRDKWPPRYRRDAATGRMLVHEVRAEMSDGDRRALREAAGGDPVGRDRSALRNLERHWARRRERRQRGGGDAGDGDDEEGDLVDDWGRRVRETSMGTNVLGRSVRSQFAAEALDDGTALGRDDASGFSQHLTPAEFRSFQEFLRRRHGVEVGDDDLPVQEASHPAVTPPSSSDADGEDPDDARRSLQWLTERARRQMDDLADDDNPYAELMPGDLSPTPLVNRKRAKLLPRELLSYNNVELLQYFLTPTGQIKNRVQTRLGAKDQRKVARLVKRARALGLVPHVGQFKVEKRGWIHAEDLGRDRPWEKELARRGLVVRRRDGDGAEAWPPSLSATPAGPSS